MNNKEQDLLKKYEKKNYYSSLALESYEDNTGINNKLVEDAWNLINEYRKIKDTLSLEKRIKFAKEISEKFDSAIAEIGKEKFIFYDDGVINYIWKGGKEIE